MTRSETTLFAASLAAVIAAGFALSLFSLHLLY